MRSAVWLNDIERREKDVLIAKRLSPYGNELVSETLNALYTDKTFRELLHRTGTDLDNNLDNQLPEGVPQLIAINELRQRLIKSLDQEKDETNSHLGC